ncbi:MAG TPA: hypothetical protein IAD23_05245 [Candidatus Scubalenecus merdavium]|uniref:Cell division protein FtsL n=1 Tax=Candidatus Scybalenecus merdavium TaxID=2840939 RepID=A0A9D1SND2_9FIRM|nr:hypothetical protein [Candidatus Scubalenecus merdavium]
MTTSGDFRRYAQNSAAYDLSFFEAQRPRPAEQEERRKRSIRVVEPKPLTGAQLRAEQKACTSFNIRVMCVVAVCFAFLAASVAMFAYTNQLTHEVSSIEDDISYAQAENTQLTSTLDSMVSLSEIDDYAVNVLGMTKVQASQVRYIDGASFKQARDQQIEAPRPSDILKNKQVIS